MGNAIIAWIVAFTVIVSAIIIWNYVGAPIMTDVMPDLENNTVSADPSGDFNVVQFYDDLDSNVKIGFVIVVLGMIIYGIRQATKEEYDTTQLPPYY